VIAGADMQVGRLAGTLVRPRDARALALILPGSGPTDRDGNGPPGSGLSCDAYAKLAGSLADLGIASLRADKRGLGASGGDGNAVTLADYVDDCAQWLAHMAGQGLPLWLIGHSEGGLVALRAAGLSGVAGVVLLACPGRRVDDVLTAQLAAGPHNADLIPLARDSLDRLAQGRPVDTSPLPSLLRGLFAPAVQGFWTSLLAHDPAELVAAVTCPLLIIGGGQDLQVPADDAVRLASRAGQADLHILPLMNHVLADVPHDDIAANLAAYADPALPLSPTLAPLIAAHCLGALMTTAKRTEASRTAPIQ
jgi:uncharacterized protein